MVFDAESVMRAIDPPGKLRFTVGNLTFGLTEEELEQGIVRNICRNFERSIFTYIYPSSLILSTIRR